MKILVDEMPKNEEIIYCTNDNSCYVYMDSHFKKFNTAENTIKKNYSNKVYSCPCCGAPHKPSEARCEYCGNYFMEEAIKQLSDSVSEQTKENIDVKYNFDKDNKALIEAFAKIGISLKDENGDFISTYDALKKISEKYNEWLGG